MRISSKTGLLSLASLGLLSAVEVDAVKITFCVRQDGNEEEGFGPFVREKHKTEHIADMITEWDESKFQVRIPDQRAHIHGVDGKLNSKCQLVHTNGERKKLSLCHREPGSEGVFKKDRGPVEKFSPEYVANYKSMEVHWPGERVRIKGKMSYLDEMCKPSDERVTPSVYGDPHFSTWAGETFDFHGACDLVMVDTPSFSDGLGLKVHIRTSLDPSHSWSYISSAVIQVGDNTIEVTGGDDTAPTYWINSQEAKDVQDGEELLGDFPILFKRIKDHQARVRLDIGNGNAIAIETYKRFVRVNLANKEPDAFVGSVGVLGSYEGEMLGRDGQTIIKDPIKFGQEWQVLSSEPMLFHEAGLVQHPTKCIMPDFAAATESRRLGEGISEEDAFLACARVGDANRDACIFDVMATNDKGMAGSY